jgi:hypothetical protein
MKKKVVVDFNQVPPRVLINPANLPKDNYLVDPDMKKASKYPSHYWIKNGDKINILPEDEAKEVYNKVHSVLNPGNPSVKKVVHVYKKSVEYLQPDYVRIILASSIITLFFTNLFLYSGELWNLLQSGLNIFKTWLISV